MGMAAGQLEPQTAGMAHKSSAGIPQHREPKGLEPKRWEICGQHEKLEGGYLSNLTGDWG